MIVKVLVLAFLLGTVPCLVASTSKPTKETIVSGNKKRSYYLFIPEKIKATARAPLIVLLHGSDRDGLSLIDKWKDLAEDQSIVLAGPNSADSSGWRAPVDGPEFLYDVIESLKAKYAIDPRRVYLFGHSAGASFALEMALMESEYFAATAVHAGALPQGGGALIDYAKRRIPLAIFVGDRDPFFPLTIVRTTRDKLVARGFAVVLSEIPNHDHWYYDLAPKINQSAWDFLKKQSLATDSHYEHYQFKN
jgi:poly(3-hydroxybutyrate) depolymerase